MSKIDLYNLKSSDSFTVTGREEVTTNLQLSSSPASQEGIISGTVTSGGQPVADVIVKVFDVNDNPIAHAITGPQGQYTIPAVVSGSYKVTVSKQGYITPSAVAVTVKTNQPTTVNFQITTDPSATLNTLYGKVKQDAVLTPVSHAVVNIFKVESSERVLTDSTLTNESGQYLSPNLSTGSYVISVNKAGYYQEESSEITLTSGDRVPVDLFLAVNEQVNTGTVSGIITDKVTLLPISGAAVALYSINAGAETIIQMTKTNVGGRYLFGNIPAGTYLVKVIAQTDAPES